MEKYKVLHIITRWMRGGGAERNTYFTIKGLDKEKYDIDLVIGGDSETVPKDLGVRIIRIKNLKRNVYLIPDLIALFQLYRLIKREKYHLVHTHQSKAGFLGRIAGKLAGRPVVIHTLHGPLFHENLNPFLKRFFIVLEKIGAIFTDHFVSVGRDLRDYYLEKGIGQPEKYSIIRSYIELDKFQEALNFSDQQIREIKNSLGLNNEALVIGMVGRLEKSKGWEEAIKVADGILKRYPKLKFLFVGKGSFRPELEKIVEKKGLQSSIIFTGFRKDIEKIIAIFDILILTTPKEGLSQTLVQGALLGKPMISFNVLGAREMIKENGFVVSAGNVKRMVEKIDYLLSDLERARRMGEKGKELVNKEWEFETIIEKNNKLYEDLLRSKNL